MADRPAPREVAAALDRLLERPPLPALSTLAREHHGRVMLAGGAIRDALLARPHDDLDIVVEEGLDGFLDSLAAVRGRPATAIGDRFQDTHRLRWSGVQVDVARALGSLEEDLGRRDFTVNALGLELPGTSPARLLDPHGGVVDLGARRLRQTEPGVIAADPLRALRGVRYLAALEGFELEEETADVIREQAPKLTEVASERWVAEWTSILELAAWDLAARRARVLEVDGPTIGRLRTLAPVDAWSRAGGEGGSGDGSARGGRPRIRLATLILAVAGGDGLEPVIERLQEARWPRRPLSHAARVAEWARELAEEVGEGAPDRLAAIALEDPDAARDAADLARALRGSRGDEDAIERLARFAGRAREPRWISGQDLLEAGVEEGPRLGELLQRAATGQIRRRWEGPEQARGWLERVVDDPGEET